VNRRDKLRVPKAIRKAKQDKNKSPHLTRGNGILQRRIPASVILDFTRYLSVMIRAHVPIIQTLESTSRQIAHEGFNKIIVQIIKDVKNGKNFATALSKHPHVFDTMYIHLVETGEATGIMGLVLEKLALHLEKQNQMKQKVRKALAYPVFVLAITLMVLVFLLTIIVPTFAEMYADYNAELPLPTQAIIYVSGFVTNYFLLIMLTISSLGFFIYKYIKQENGKRLVDRLMLLLPVTSGFYIKRINTQFCQTMGTLLSNGVRLVDALEISQKSISNIHIAEGVTGIIKAVKQGRSFSASAHEAGFFPQVVLQMIMAGEETAELDKIFLHISETNQQEIDLDLETLTTLLEPFLIVIIGIMIGFVIVAMYLPIFELMNIIN